MSAELPGVDSERDADADEEAEPGEPDWRREPGEGGPGEREPEAGDAEEAAGDAEEAAGDAEEAAGDAEEAEQDLDDPAMTVESLAEQALAEQALAEQTFGEQSFGEQTFGEQSFGEQTFGEQSFGEQTFGEQSFGEQALEAVGLYGAAKPLAFVDVVVALPSTNPVVILREVDEPFRELHIPVGLAEGQAISYAARGIPTPKPLTHELFVDALAAFGLAVEVVRITNVAGRAFYADLVLSGNSTTKVLTCRPSDGICLALRSVLPVPITAAEHVLEEAGVLN